MKFLLIGLTTLISFGSFSSPLEVNASSKQNFPDDIASTLTFENNTEISVKKEVLNINLNKDTANVEAVYTMYNLTNNVVSTESMFISPNINKQSAKVVIKDEEVSCIKNTYYTCSSYLEVSDWKYSVYVSVSEYSHNYYLDEISFEMTFQPKETYDVYVSFDYSLRGGPKGETDVREFLYYLSPVKEWVGFDDLTINVKTNEAFPELTSNYFFELIDENTYQCKTSAFNQEYSRLSLRLHQGPWDSFLTTLTDPTVYLVFGLYVVLGAIIVLPVVGIIIIIVKRKKRKNE